MDNPSTDWFAKFEKDRLGSISSVIGIWSHPRLTHTEFKRQCAVHMGSTTLNSVLDHCCGKSVLSFLVNLFICPFLHIGELKRRVVEGVGGC